MKRSLELQVKICSLAAEAVIIRRLERKQLSAARRMKAAQSNRADEFYSRHLSLRHHRVLDVRNEARASLLAQAFIRGIPYALTETLPKKHRADRRFEVHVVLHRAADLVLKYSPIEGGLEGKPADVAIPKWYSGRKSRIVALMRAWAEVPSTGSPR